MTYIVHIISDTNIGGGGRSLLNYLACHDPERFRLRVILPRGSALTERVLALGIPADEIDAMADKSMDFKAISPLAAILRREQPDLVHTHGSLSGRMAARMAGCQVIYTRHCTFPPGHLAASLPGRLAVKTLDALLSDGTIAIGAAAKEILTATGIPAGKIHVMLNGVQPLPIPTAEEKAALRRQCGFSDTDFVVGILARVEEYKGQGILLEAVKQLTAQGRQVKLLVAGQGPYEPQLRELAGGLPAGTVHFAGFVREVERAFGAMDVQINASFVSEASPLSLLEGMSMGLPAIVSDIGGNPLHISHGENGLVVPAKDPAALAAAIAQVMDDPSLCRHMQQKALDIFEARFTADAFARHLERIYCQILQKES